MNSKEKFLDNISNNLKDISLNDAKRVIYELASRLDESEYKLALCIIDNIKGNKINTDDLLKEVNDIKMEYKKIEDGDVCIRCYETNSYDYSPFGEDYYFYPSKELDDILNTSYELGKNLIYMKEYDIAIEIFNLILYTNYQCEEIGNPEYTDSNEVLDVFDTNIYSIKDTIDFNFDYVFLYSIYAILISDYPDKYKRIYDYLTNNMYLDIKRSIDLGIEKINNMDKVYEEFKEYLQTKEDITAKEILKIMK